MGLRHRSIRLRVGILIAVPVLCLVLVYAFTASVTLGNALTETRASSLINDLGLPVSGYQQQLAIERGLALLSLAEPANSQLALQLGQQEAATDKALRTLEAAFHAPAIAAHASAAEQAAMRALVKQASGLYLVRANVSNSGINLSAALSAYDSDINASNGLIDTVIDAQANVPFVTQAVDVLALDRADQATTAETDLLSADLAAHRFPESDRLTLASLASTRQQLTAQALPDVSQAYGPGFTHYLTTPAASAITAAESTVAQTPWRSGRPPAVLAAARNTFVGYSQALTEALTVAGVRLQQTSQQQAQKVRLQLVLAAGLGLLALITSLVLSLVLGRGLVRQLRELRESALTLAHTGLPGIISRLRSGEAVDLEEYAPAEVPTKNEIEQVQQAFSVVQHAAVQSAVDEARLRRGISDVFRNLAGRSQSLLHRQLTLLDGMERRATEPDELEDLFRIDHLTTRMRRHAEGLIILSGDTPARGWRQPVPLVDVLRAAVAEVEDYTRIRVLCRTGAAVAGHAVADVIHLLAELAENATVFSPPNTPVRMQGDAVGRGFAIEIEDRGLGISPARLDEINANLANPPQFDLSGSDRLGLFIASQLAQRHDIKVTLRPSVYGGTTAIVLIPTALVVEENVLDRDPALPAGQDERLRFERIGGRHAALTAIPAGNGFAASSANGHRSPAGDPDRDSRDGGFTLGRLTPAEPGTDGTRPDPVKAQPLRLAEPVRDEDTDAPAPTAAELAELGLPVRVRQASLAPQLRDTPPGGPADAGPVSGGFSLPLRGASAAGSFTPAPAAPADADPAGAPASPEAARDMVSALQRGWQLGRAETAAESAEPPDDETRNDVTDAADHRDED